MCRISWNNKYMYRVRVCFVRYPMWRWAVHSPLNTPKTTATMQILETEWMYVCVIRSRWNDKLCATEFSSTCGVGVCTFAQRAHAHAIYIKQERAHCFWMGKHHIWFMEHKGREARVQECIRTNITTSTVITHACVCVHEQQTSRIAWRQFAALPPTADARKGAQHHHQPQCMCIWQFYTATWVSFRCVCQSQQRIAHEARLGCSHRRRRRGRRGPELETHIAYN